MQDEFHDRTRAEAHDCPLLDTSAEGSLAWFVAHRPVTQQPLAILRRYRPEAHVADEVVFRRLPSHENRHYS